MDLPGPSFARAGRMRTCTSRGWARRVKIANLRGLPDAEAAARRHADGRRGLPAGAWVEGRGWDQNLWPGKEFPDARILDRALPDRPAVARRVDGHAVWVNTAALEGRGHRCVHEGPRRRADRAAERRQRPRACSSTTPWSLLDRALPAATAADRERWLLAGSPACARAGLTEVQDASGYGAATLAVLERLAAAGKLPIRVYATVSPEREQLAGAPSRRGPRLGGGSDFLTVRAIKAVRGRRARQPRRGAARRLRRRAREARPPRDAGGAADRDRAGGAEAGLAALVHAIGDRGQPDRARRLRSGRGAVPILPRAARARASSTRRSSRSRTSRASRASASSPRSSPRTRPPTCRGPKRASAPSRIAGPTPGGG